MDPLTLSVFLEELKVVPVAAGVTADVEDWCCCCVADRGTTVDANAAAAAALDGAPAAAAANAEAAAVMAPKPGAFDCVGCCDELELSWTSEKKEVENTINI